MTCLIVYILSLYLKNVQNMYVLKQPLYFTTRYISTVRHVCKGTCRNLKVGPLCTGSDYMHYSLNKENETVLYRQ
jgi:hypothetical protein